MGARVNDDGTPSNALQRRLEGALASASRLGDDVVYLASGGRSGNGPSEAEVMKTWLVAAGVGRERIVLDTASEDTLSSVLACGAVLTTLAPLGTIVVCSDVYHQARCRILFRLLGFTTVNADTKSGRRANGLLRWMWYYVREALAIPYDIALLLLQKKRHAV
jgi:vancomycin permeability regulator SanA